MSKTEDKITLWVEKYLVDFPHLFLVEARIVPPLRLSIALDGEPAVTIDECTQLSRSIGTWLEENNIIDKAYILEVGSPGVDKPLRMPRQYYKNIGRSLKVSLLNEKTKLEGLLTQATEHKITLQVTTGKGKKAETAEHIIEYTDIKEAKIALDFK